MKLLDMVRVDNLGAIFMASNTITTSDTKHVNIRHKYMNKYVEDGVVEIAFVEFADNDGNILSKNSFWSTWEALKENGSCEV